MTNHMCITPMRPKQPGDEERAKALVAQVRAAIEKYQDYKKAIADGKHLTYKKSDPKPQRGLATDRQTLDALMTLMVTTRTIEWLRTFNFAGYSFDTNNLNGIGTYTSQQGPERKFVDDELEVMRDAFEAAATAFLNVVGIETFPMGSGRNTVPQEWELESPERFDRVVRELHGGAELVCTTYDALVGADAVVLVTEWNEFRNPDFERMKRILKSPVIFDGRNVYEPQQMAALGFTYYSMGRRTVRGDKDA